MSLTLNHLKALEASAAAAAASAHALLAQIAALRIALNQEESAETAAPLSCPKCKADAEFLVPADGKMFCRVCKAIF